MKIFTNKAFIPYWSDFNKEGVKSWSE